MANVCQVLGDLSVISLTSPDNLMREVKKTLDNEESGMEKSSPKTSG